jgi:hypothetical protein
MGLNLTGVHLIGVHLTGMYLIGVHLIGARLCARCTPVYVGCTYEVYATVGGRLGDTRLEDAPARSIACEYV